MTNCIIIIFLETNYGLLFPQTSMRRSLKIPFCLKSKCIFYSLVHVNFRVILCIRFRFCEHFVYGFNQGQLHTRTINKSIFINFININSPEFQTHWSPRVIFKSLKADRIADLTESNTGSFRALVSLLISLL